MNLTWTVLKIKLGSYFPGQKIGRAKFKVDPVAKSAVGAVWNEAGASTGEITIPLNPSMVSMLGSGFTKAARPDVIDAGMIDVDFVRKFASVEIFYQKDGYKLRHTENHNW